jgi:hypothetical protein
VIVKVNALPVKSIFLKTLLDAPGVEALLPAANPLKLSMSSTDLPGGCPSHVAGRREPPEFTGWPLGWSFPNRDSQAKASGRGDGCSGIVDVVFQLHPGSTDRGPTGAEVLFVYPWCPEKKLSTWFSP